jgi:hypothetical protein
VNETAEVSGKERIGRFWRRKNKDCGIRQKKDWKTELWWLTRTVDCVMGERTKPTIEIGSTKGILKISGKYESRINFLPQ